MWTPVDFNDLAQLQKTVLVLLAHEPRWNSPGKLRKWIEERDARLFYYDGPKYQLVVGFRFVAKKKEWRVVIGGGRGALDVLAAKLIIDRVLEFTIAQHSRTIAMYNNWRIPLTNPNRMLIDGAIAMVREDPRVEKVRQRLTGIGERYEAVMRQSAM